MTKINEERLWETPLFRTHIGPDKKILDYILDNRDNIRDINEDPNGAWVSETNLDFPDLKNTIKELSKSLFGKNVTDITFTNMWANILKKGQYHLLHSHNEHTMSGAYYLQVPVNSGQIYFKDPRPQTNSWTQKFIDKGNMRFYNPVAGDLFMWPSFLEHGTTPHDNFEERIMISFDLRFNGPGYKYGHNGYNGI
jgi:hypothetical protein